MGVAIAAISLGAWMVYSALKGQSLADVFKGDGGTLDPAGRIPIQQAEQATGVDPTKPLPGGLSTGGTNDQRMVAEMNRMIAQHQPYKWGGGHASFSQNGPWDCSGAVSWLARYMGFLSGSPMISTGFMRWGQPGRGKVFTIYSNPTHVFIHKESGGYAGQDWGTTHSAPGGGVGWHTHTKAGFVPRHWEGW